MKMVQLVALLRHQSRSESGSYVEKYCGLDDTDYPRKVQVVSIYNPLRKVVKLYFSKKKN